MCKLAQDCPGYGFESHKGYGVPEHLAALNRLGPTVHHRRFFAPVVAAREKHQATTIEDVTIENEVIENKLADGKLIPAELTRDTTEVSAAAV
jgi:hypothetical protein